MTDTATPDRDKLAATIEADALLRAGHITLTQAKTRILDRKASPVAHLALRQTDDLNRALAVLRELHSTCVLMDHPDEMQRPTEDDYQAAMTAAARELGRH